VPSIKQTLAKPQYIYRPGQLIRRFTQRGSEPVVQTPWGCPMRVRREDVLGAGIARMGVHELAVSEAMWRLSEPDDLAIDVGANIGYFTGLLAARAHQVIALEPSPQVQDVLAENIARWENASRVRLDKRAASRAEGMATLSLPADHRQNHGLATLERTLPSVAYDVETVRLDSIIAGRAVGILKIDVEGHETAVLEGASESLDKGLIRDIVFEEHDPLPSRVSRLLEAASFAISGIEQTLRGPVLVERRPSGWEAPTYVATRDPERMARLMRPRGWECLRGGRARAPAS
jgi:FkbM family methyltransferase